jgi:phenylalanyl-tRNA synthetase beta chain
MRQTLLFGALESVLHNINHKNPDVKLYEFGNTYKKETPNKNQKLQGYTEELHLSLAISGLKQQPNWITREELSNFHFIKAYAENILRRLGLNPDKLVVVEFSNDIFAEGLNYTINKNSVLSLGLLNRKLLQKADIKAPVYYADFNWEQVMALIKNNKIAFEELPRFPEVRRDLSMVLAKEIKFEQIRTIAMKTEKVLLKRINLFDVYEGDKIEKGKKSYAVSFYLQDLTKTLTDEQIDKIMDGLVKAFERELGAQIRS